MYDLPFDTLNELASRCVDLWVKDPTAAQAVALTCRGAIGKGIEKPRIEQAGTTPKKPARQTAPEEKRMQEAKADPAQGIIDECWESQANQRTLFGQEAMTRLIRKLFCEGEVFVAVYTSAADDKVRLAMMDRREFPRVLTHPQDKTHPIAYRREWREATYDAATGHSTQQTDRRVAHYADVEELLRDPEEDDPEGDAFLQKLKCETDIHILHVKVNTLGLRGIPELARILDWARGHNVSLSSLVTLAKALSTLAWTMKHDSTSKAAVQAASRLFQDPTPGVGSVASFTARSDLQPVNAPTGGISNNETATRQTLLEMARPFGFGEHWYGDPSSGNLATATSMELPAVWTIEFWQELLREVILKVLRIAVARAQNVKAALGVAVDVDFPDAQPTTPQELANLLTAVTTATGKAVLDEYEAAYQVLTALGVNNPQEVLERQYPDGPPMGKTQAEKDVEGAAMAALRQKAAASAPEPPPGGNGQPPPAQSAAIQEAVRRIEDVLPFGLARADDLSDRFARALQREISRWHNDVARWLRTLDDIPPRSAFDALLLMHGRPDESRIAEVIRRYMRMAANLGGNWAIQKLVAARKTLGMMREAVDWKIEQKLTDAEWLAQHTDAAGNWIPEEVLAEKLQRGEGWNQLDGNWGGFHLRDPKMLEELKTAGGKITGTVTDTMLADLRRNLDDSFYRQGQSPLEVARNMEDVFPKTYGGRAENIARTETTKAVSQYELSTYAANGIEESEWLAILDPLVRDAHRAMNGQVRKIGVPFNAPDGREVPSPGDGPPDLACNCRCDLLPVIGDDTKLPEKPWTGQPLTEWQKQQAAPVPELAQPVKKVSVPVLDVPIDLAKALPSKQPSAVAAKSAEELRQGYRDAELWMNEVQTGTPDVRFERGAPFVETPQETKARISSELAVRLNGNEVWEAYAKTHAPTFEEAASELIMGWARTSGDSDPYAIAMQRAVKAEFGLTDSTMAHLGGNAGRLAEAEYEKNGAAYRAFVRAMYENTQADLKARGITELPVYRGAAFSNGKVAKTVTMREDVLLQPASSYSLDPITAHSFATDFEEKAAVRTVVHEVVPAENVLSTAIKGFGCRNEEEVVVLGGRRTATVIKWSKGDPVDDTGTIQQTRDAWFKKFGGK